MGGSAVCVTRELGGVVLRDLDLECVSFSGAVASYVVGCPRIREYTDRRMMAKLLGRCVSLPWRARIGAPIVVLILVLFMCVGIDVIIHPKRHMNLYLRSGGEMRREWNEIGVQFVGLVFSCGSAWMLFEVVQSVWADCFG